MARPQTISDDQILEAARRCLLELGPQATMEAIAGGLGVSPQALIKRFGSKQQLVVAALCITDEPAWRKLVEAGPDDRPAADQLREILQALAGFFVDVVRRMSVLRWSGVQPEELLKQFEEPPPLVDVRVLAGWFRRAYQRGLIREIDDEATAMLALTSLHGPAMITEMLGRRPTRHSQPEYVDYLVDVLLTGLSPGQNATSGMA
ncbi:MAG: TetR/AcrR family transcriptional regulator [Planctomycetaceae bacterium]|nr:TetR/AcrR family transcriptional regulator [Planctomycetaceae bacterium]